ncbi:oligosaccharide flippase family protein [Lactococcus fujiensis]|uniref:Polysaccharide biosynthesis protein n=1 Tax=Lactococcus fujiensis JCM 16395 TaxID=1291764 RepID=A0A2A5RPR1_9LACT|nr:oligosaccharide flippase family protein [Lactococcus fujiensis]PCS01435.1 polysaccharide biosynthesis protein [Lactococcus fujiensis JCM 16395]
MRLFKNYLLNSSYQILLILLPLITAPYLSRVLGASGVGINAFTNSVVFYFSLFSILGTFTYGNREIAYYQNDKKKRSEIFWGINFLSWMIAGITYIVFLIFISMTQRYQAYYLWQSLIILANLFDISWYFMGMEKFKITVTRNLIFKILTVIAIFIFVRDQNDLIRYIAIAGIGSLLSSLSLWPY